MKDVEIKSGNFSIDKHFLKINGTSYNISSIVDIGIEPLARHSLISGVITWGKCWIFFLIVCVIFYKISILDLFFTIYTLSIFVLLFYNFQKHKEQWYSLNITTSNSKVQICSLSEDFLRDVQEAIESAMDSNENFVINMDNRHVINNGIINNGNHNVSEVVQNGNNH